MKSQSKRWRLVQFYKSLSATLDFALNFEQWYLRQNCLLWGWGVKGRMICIEGLEGAGKSSAIAMIKAFVEALGHEVVATREPGGTPIAETLRKLIKHGQDDEMPTIQSETLLLYAARSQLLQNLINPALASGKWIIADRHNLSTYAYQGAGRGVSLEVIQHLSDFCLDGFKPDITLYLDLPPEVGLKRIQSRGKTDRIEQEAVDFFHRIREAYLSAAKHDTSIKVVDASVPIEDVHLNIKRHLNKWYDTIC